MSKASEIVDSLLEALNRRDFLSRLGTALAGITLAPHATLASGPKNLVQYIGGRCLKDVTLPKGYILTRCGLYGNPEEPYSLLNGYTEAGSQAAKYLERVVLKGEHYYAIDPILCSRGDIDLDKAIKAGIKYEQDCVDYLKKTQKENEEWEKEQKSKREEREKQEKEQAREIANARSRFDYAGGNEDDDYANYSESRAIHIVNSLLEADPEPKGVDFRKWLSTHTDAGSNPVIKTAYAKYSEESIANGEAAEEGWEDEEGVSMLPDQYDLADGKTTVDLAVKFLSDNGATQPSNSGFSAGTWYTDCDSSYDADGMQTEHSYHLSGFTPEDEEHIFNRMKHVWAA